MAYVINNLGQFHDSNSWQAKSKIVQSSPNRIYLRIEYISNISFFLNNDNNNSNNILFDRNHRYDNCYFDQKAYYYFFEKLIKAKLLKFL